MKKFDTLVEEIISSIPYYKQKTDYTCGPASARMALSSLGIDMSEEELTNILKPSSKIGTKKDSWNNLKDIVNVKIVEDSTVEELEKLRNEGYVIILNVEHHYIVYDGKEGDEIKVLDPFDSNITSLNIEKFYDKWHDDVGKPPTNRMLIALRKL